MTGVVGGNDGVVGGNDGSGGLPQVDGLHGRGLSRQD